MSAQVAAAECDWKGAHFGSLVDFCPRIAIGAIRGQAVECISEHIGDRRKRAKPI